MTFYRLHQPSKLLALTTGVSLLVHVLLWLLLQGADFSFLEPSAPTPTVELVLADEPAAATAPPAATPPEQADPAPPDAAASDQPRDITLTPERLATAPPDRADYLSDVDSRAADLIPGGTAGAQPGARNDADHQSVAIVEEQLGGEGVVAVEEPVFEPEAARPPAEQPPATAPGSETSPQGDMPTAEIEERREQPAEEAAEAGAETEPREASDYEDWVPSSGRPRCWAQRRPRLRVRPARVRRSIETNVDIVGGYPSTPTSGTSRPGSTASPTICSAPGSRPMPTGWASSTATPRCGW